MLAQEQGQVSAYFCLQGAKGFKITTNKSAYEKKTSFIQIILSHSYIQHIYEFSYLVPLWFRHLHKIDEYLATEIGAREFN